MAGMNPGGDGRRSAGGASSGGDAEASEALDAGREEVRDIVAQAFGSKKPPDELTDAEKKTKQQESKAKSIRRLADDYNRPWFERRDDGWYCNLCKKWSTSTHVESKMHRKRAEDPWYTDAYVGGAPHPSAWCPDARGGAERRLGKASGSAV